MKCARAALAVLLLALATTSHAQSIISEPTSENVRAALEAEPIAGLKIDTVALSDDKEVRVTVTGTVERNSQLSNFLRWIDSSQTFHSPELVSIVTLPEGRNRFELQARLTPPPAPPPPPAPVRRTAYRCMIDGKEVFQPVPCPAR